MTTLLSFPAGIPGYQHYMCLYHTQSHYSDTVDNQSLLTSDPLYSAVLQGYQVSRIPCLDMSLSHIILILSITSPY